MKCPRCEAENRDGARFCRECGTTFAAACPACGTTLEAGSKFCDRCRAPLGATPAPSPGSSHRLGAETAVASTADVIRAPKSVPEAERRQLHPLLRDQRAIAGIGRAHANEILLRARLSPFKASTELDADEVERLATALHEDLARALELRERGKGDRDVYLIHARLGKGPAYLRRR